MKKQVIVVGLGHFGMSVARALSEREVEVLAVDIREDRVRHASAFVAQAACFDATDSEAMSRISPERREVCICAIGDDSREAAIICTALLRQIGARRVIARANDEVLKRILLLVGAHRVVDPEREFGEGFASQVIHENILGELRLSEGLLLSEFQAPDLLVGHTLSELQLQRRFGVTVIAIRRGDLRTVLPDAQDPVQRGDILVVVAREGAVDQLLKRS